MSGPRRIQRSRAKGWQMPEGAVYVGRPSPWGNPYPIAGDWIMWAAVALRYRADARGRRAASVAIYRAWLTSDTIALGPYDPASGILVWSDGRETTIEDHIGGFALWAARQTDAPSVPAMVPGLAPLRGRDLACWCPLDQPCHADVLLELANLPATDTRHQP